MYCIIVQHSSKEPQKKTSFLAMQEIPSTAAHRLDDWDDWVPNGCVKKGVNSPSLRV